jgi:hypothetical protein
MDMKADTYLANSMSRAQPVHTVMISETCAVLLDSEEMQVI